MTVATATTTSVPRDEAHSDGSVRAKARPKKQYRVQLDMNDRDFARLNRLCEINDRTKSDILRDALQVFEWITDLDDQGAEFLVKKADGTTVEVKIF